MGLVELTAPSTEPVSVADAKAFCRVESADEDGLFTAWIKTARQHIEQLLDRSVAEHTYKLSLDRFDDTIRLPRPPVTTVTALQYIDPDGIEQTVASSNYSVDLTGRTHWLVRNSDYTWPETLGAINSVSVTYDTGILPTSGDDLWTAILFQVLHYFDRGESDAETSPTVLRLINSYRKVL